MQTRNGLDDDAPDWFWRLQRLVQRLNRGEVTEEEADEEIEAMKAAAAAEGRKLDVSFARTEIVGAERPDSGGHRPEARRARRQRRHGRRSSRFE